MNLEKQFVTYCSETPEFTLKEAEIALGQKKIHGQSIADFLEYCQLVFSKTIGKKSEKFISRHDFFKGMKFRVVLSEYERKNLVLIPGHRFIPFYFSDIFTHSFVLEDRITNASLSSKKLTSKLSDLYEYYYAFNSETITECLIAEDEANAKVVGKNPKGQVKVHAYDLKELKKSSKLKEFNSIVFEVKDWTKGIFRAELRNEDSHLDKEQAFIFAEELESSLYKVFEKYGPYLDIPEQIALAYFFSDKKFLLEPVISLEEALELAQNIEIKYFEDNTILWFKNDDGSSWEKNHGQKKEDIFSISSGKTASIDAILDELGFPLTTQEFSLFINVFKGKYSSCHEFITDILPGKIAFKDKAQEVIFLNQVEELFENSAIITLPGKKSKEFTMIEDSINRLKNILNSYHPDKLTLNQPHEQASLAYREIRDQVNSLSSVLHFYFSSPHSLDQIERISDLESYIENHFTILKELIS